MKCDKKGRFSKEEDENDGYNINLALPSFRSLLCWLIIIVILLPWTVIFARFNIFKKIFGFFENLMSKREEEEETPKKMAYFIKKEHIIKKLI